MTGRTSILGLQIVVAFLATVGFAVSASAQAPQTEGAPATTAPATTPNPTRIQLVAQESPALAPATGTNGAGATNPAPAGPVALPPPGVNGGLPNNNTTLGQPPAALPRAYPSTGARPGPRGSAPRAGMSPDGLPPRPEQGNDPTVPGPAIRELLGQGKPREQQQGPSELPEVRLKARIAVAGRPVVAVIEIGGRSVTVQEGDEFTVPAGGELMPVRVTSLTVSNLQLELVNRRAVVNLR
jgi:hypothetical protein